MVSPLNLWDSRGLGIDIRLETGWGGTQKAKFLEKRFFFNDHERPKTSLPLRSSESKRKGGRDEGVRAGGWAEHCGGKGKFRATMEHVERLWWSR